MVQAPPEPEVDEPGRLVVGQREQRHGIDVADERLDDAPGRVGIGQSVQLASEGERIVEVLAAERTELDARRTRHGQAADRSVGIAEAHDDEPRTASG